MDILHINKQKIKLHFRQTYDNNQNKIRTKKNYLTKKKHTRKISAQNQKINKNYLVVAREFVSPSSKFLPTKEEGGEKYQPTR